MFVSTPEGEHAAPIKRAIELGTVLVEMPITLALNDAEDILATLKATGGDLRVGYSHRYKECYLRAKVQMIHGRPSSESYSFGIRLPLIFHHRFIRDQNNSNNPRGKFMSRSITATGLPVLLVFLWTIPALGQDYPNRPLRIVTSGVGGAGDIAARLIGGELSSK